MFVFFASALSFVPISHRMADNDIAIQKEAYKQAAKYKTSICKRFAQFGSCREGFHCSFAHSEGELRLKHRNEEHPRYKTSLCLNFERDGRCPYAIKCCFIHRRLPHPVMTLPSKPTDSPSTSPVLSLLPFPTPSLPSLDSSFTSHWSAMEQQLTDFLLADD